MYLSLHGYLPLYRIPTDFGAHKFCRLCAGHSLHTLQEQPWSNFQLNFLLLQHGYVTVAKICLPTNIIGDFYLIKWAHNNSPKERICLYF